MGASAFIWFRRQNALPVWKGRVPRGTVNWDLMLPRLGKVLSKFWKFLSRHATSSMMTHVMRSHLHHYCPPPFHYFGMTWSGFISSMVRIEASLSLVITLGSGLNRPSLPFGNCSKELPWRSSTVMYNWAGGHIFEDLHSKKAICNMGESVSGGVQEDCPASQVFFLPPRLKNLSDTEVKVHPGTVGACGPSEGTLAGAVSTTPWGRCRWIPVALACRHLARSPRWQMTATSTDVLLTFKGSSNALGWWAYLLPQNESILVRGSSWVATRQNLFLSSLRFVTHLSLRSSLMFVRAELIGLWADDTGNSQILSSFRAFPVPSHFEPYP